MSNYATLGNEETDKFHCNIPSLNGLKYRKKKKKKTSTAEKLLICRGFGFKPFHGEKCLGK